MPPAVSNVPRNQRTFADICRSRWGLQRRHQSLGEDISNVRELQSATRTQARLDLQDLSGNGLHTGPGREALRSSFNLILGTLLLTLTTDGEQGQRARFSPASWMSWLWGFELIGKKVCGRPHFLFRTFNIIQRDDPIRLACACGDLEEVERLFHKGLATPYDVTSEGSTLLHVSYASLALVYISFSSHLINLTGRCVLS